ncbi:MAG: type II secretion system protein [Chroococcidiopsidaceae cyanobacterium CP_BM_RX_35]|nr:type II secretion system protein [Chroococcidiopsidaceae cyanobacterium CP_BM_RX_35]
MTSGFTITEALIVVLIIGILSAITIPSWLSFLNILRLNSAQEQVYLAMREAQSNAIRDKLTWQASFREIVDQNGEDLIQWAIHSASVNPTTANWHNLEAGIHLDDETTLQKFAGVSRVQFDYRGHVVLYQSANLWLGRLTLSIPDGSAVKRCIVVSTYLGALRSGQDHPNPALENGKIYYCY